MVELDELVPNYRRAQRRWPNAPTLGKHYEALSTCFSASGHGLVEYVKSFIESLCLTIMGELCEPMPSSKPSTTDLFVAALSPLGLRNTKGANKLDKVLSGFNRLSDALTEMRNEDGPVAHGKDGFLDPVTADHARVFLLIGDAILGVLLNAFEGKEPDLSMTREPYENFPHHNKHIDRAVRVDARVDEGGDRPVVVFLVATGPLGEAIELRVEPSRLLYGIDREAYIEVLKSAEPVVDEAEKVEEELETEAGAPKPAEVLWISAERGPVPVLTPTYAGKLDPFRSGLKTFLEAEKVEPIEAERDGKQLVESLLATIEQNIGLDWKENEAIQARLRVACKRVLVHFGLDADKAKAVTEHLAAWLCIQLGEPNMADTDSSNAAGGTGS